MNRWGIINEGQAGFLSAMFPLIIVVVCFILHQDQDQWTSMSKLYLKCFCILFMIGAKAGQGLTNDISCTQCHCQWAFLFSLVGVGGAFSLLFWSDAGHL
eukprot:1145420-Pelagomonas_calceolata.AAC.2